MAARGLRVGVLTMEGTNCDGELVDALEALGSRPERLHLKQLERRELPKERWRSLDDFGMLLVPGGFSGGDYVRAGAIFAARLRASVGEELEAFVRSGRIVGGICNGFQVLTELGLLPGRADGRLGRPEAALATNDSGHFECRPTWVEWTGGRFPALRETPAGERFLFPSAHAEGRLVLPDGGADRLAELELAGQVLFRWVAPDGSPATYPWNPNGSPGNVAGLTNPSGNVFGLMPHPERSFRREQSPDWTRDGGPNGGGDGRRFLAAVVREAARRAAPAIARAPRARGARPRAHAR